MKSDATYENATGPFGVRYAVVFRTVRPSELKVEWATDAVDGTNSARFTAVALR